MTSDGWGWANFNERTLVACAKLMPVKVLVFNCGSSSIKGQILDMAVGKPILTAKLDRIGQPESRLAWRQQTASGGDEGMLAIPTAGDQRVAVEMFVEVLSERSAEFRAAEFAAIGHRVVHGGDRFRVPVVINKTVLDAIAQVGSLAPLHNRASLAAIKLALDRWRAIPHVAVFDTGFHRSLLPHAAQYALPSELTERFAIRRFGFHGISHQYVTRRAAAMLDRPVHSLRLISLHLGNGASVAAIDSGASVDTSMGFTPLEGLMMSTRCGDMDPAIVSYLLRATGKTLDELDGLLRSESGLKGVCGAGDMRDVERLAAKGDGRAELALSMFCYRIKKYIGSYLAVLGGADAILFTGGIGENRATVRRLACAGLQALGIEIDPGRNESAELCEREIQSRSSVVKVLVIPTNEELQIAEEVIDCLALKKNC